MPSHSPITDTTKVNGTVQMPTRVNAQKVEWMSGRTTLRHNRFASEPAYVRFGPTLTPISTASTAGGPETSGSNTRTAGRLLTTLESSAATAAIPSSATRLAPRGNTSRMTSSRPFTMTAATTTPRHNTNARNGTS